MKMPEHIESNMFAPCGMVCKMCYRHCFSAKACLGCFKESENKPEYCRKCKIKDCVKEKALTYCYECEEFACQNLKDLDKGYFKYNTSIIEQGKKAKEQGITQFLSELESQYTCSCGGIISLHDEECTECHKKFGKKKIERKVILYVALSLDGFIADTQGKVHWLEKPINQVEEESLNEDYEKFVSQIDTVLMGKTTYTQIVNELSPHEWPYSSMKTYVMTHNKEKDTKKIAFINEDICEFVKTLKEEAGSNIWVCGGAEIANDLIKENLIDIYHLTYMPIILGSGISLFHNTNPQSKLTLKSCRNFHGRAELIYMKKQAKIIESIST